MTNAAGGPPQDSGHEQLLTVPVTTMAHGGHAVGRVDGQVVFVRHAIPGETVTARVTGQGRKGRYLTADAVEGTPTLFVNGTKYGNMGYDELKAILDAELAK